MHFVCRFCLWYTQGGAQYAKFFLVDGVEKSGKAANNPDFSTTVCLWQSSGRNDKNAKFNND